MLLLLSILFTVSLFIVLVINRINKNKENFVSIKQTQSGSQSNTNSNSNTCIRPTEVELVAKAAALEFCPVPPDFNINEWVKITDKDKINELATIRIEPCEKCPDMSEYILKSQCPPATKCPPCICPKVEIDPDICKGKNCSIEECEKVIQCSDCQKPCPVPRCPTVQTCAPCPKTVCPAITIKDQGSCPPPQRCPPVNNLCPQREACPAVESAKCVYTGPNILDNNSKE